jgi:hypothetical protein
MGDVGKKLPKVDRQLTRDVGGIYAARRGRALHPAAEVERMSAAVADLIKRLIAEEALSLRDVVPVFALGRKAATLPPDVYQSDIRTLNAHGEARRLFREACVRLGRVFRVSPDRLEAEVTDAGSPVWTELRIALEEVRRKHRRRGPGGAKKAHGLKLHVSTHQVWYGGKEVRLTGRPRAAFMFLLTLAQAARQQKVSTYRAIDEALTIDQTGDHPAAVADRNEARTALRKAFEAAGVRKTQFRALILNRHRLGYQLDLRPEDISIQD